MSRTKFLIAALAILILGGTLRTLWLRADPPTTSVGIVWHDEGAWVHNARNRALWGAWRTDNWNPVFIAPVFTALEYGAFELFGVGTWQARTVPVASGLVALAALMAGLAAIGGRRTALIGGLLLAVNYTWVMWNRAALMESTMTACVVIAWAAYGLAERRPAWGLVAGTAATLAFFTKAAAAFFVVALAADAAWTLLLGLLPGLRARLRIEAPSPANVRAAWMAVGGLALAAAIVAVTLVVPHWRDYQFYNWQMTVLRKPSYDLRSLVDRASWLPLSHDIFTRMWLVLFGAAIAIGGILARWREAKPAERLLVLWILIGLLELTIHDSGTERRYVMFVPALVALAAMLAGSGSAWLPGRTAALPLRARLLSAPFLLILGYVVLGSAIRLMFQSQIEAGVYRSAVRLSAGLAALLVVVLLVRWRPVVGWLARRRMSFGVVTALVAWSVMWNLGQYIQWAAHHAELNFQASVALGRRLEPGALVQGKLANGMALENRIRPLFVGHGFGNYEDRFARDDARYILTYELPREGYESYPGLIKEILDQYPSHRVVMTFEVDETPGADRAALIEKHPGNPSAASGSNRAPD